jgi:hypothetical protein
VRVDVSFASFLCAREKEEEKVIKYLGISNIMSNFAV